MYSEVKFNYHWMMLDSTRSFATCPNCCHAAHDNPCPECGSQISENGGLKKQLEEVKHRALITHYLGLNPDQISKMFHSRTGVGMKSLIHSQTSSPVSPESSIVFRTQRPRTPRDWQRQILKTIMKGKVYPSKIMADFVIQSCIYKSNHNKKKKVPIRAYECPFCHQWHTTSQPRKNPLNQMHKYAPKKPLNMLGNTESGQ